MKRKVTCFTSVALALLMAASPVATGSVNTFASGELSDEAIKVVDKPDDGGQVSENEIVISDTDTEPDSDDIQVETREKDSGISEIRVETDEPDNGEISVKPEKATTEAVLSIGDQEDAQDEENVGIVVEEATSYMAGDAIPLQVHVTNTGEDAIDFRLYFWDYDGEIPDKEDTQKDFWKQDLKDGCTDVQLTEFPDGEKLQVEFQDVDQTADAVLKQEKDEETGEVLSRYVSVEVPAGAVLDTTWHLVSESAETVTLVPVLTVDGEEISGDAVQAVWEEAAITVEASEEEPEPTNEGEFADDTEAKPEITVETRPVTEMDDGDALATLIEEELQDTEGPETSLIPEADTETQVEKALDEKDVDFDLEMTEPETEEASEERVTDPVIEAYIRENADPKYVSGDDMKLQNMLYVENTLADASMLEPDDTVSSVMSAENNGEIVWYVSETDVAVYSLSEDDDYWVAFADTMHDDPTAMAMDGVFALTNYDGEVVDGIFDPDTGLAYIPKNAYIDEDGVNHVYEVQCQILQAVDFQTKMAAKVTSMVSVTSETEDGEIEQTQDTDSIFNFVTKVQAEKGLDERKMQVYINGLPNSSYNYDADTGIITLSKLSADVQSVYVTENDDLSADTVRTMNAAQPRAVVGPWAPDDMETIATVTWNDGVPTVGEWYYFNLCVDYKEDGFQHKFGGSYGVSSNFNGPMSDSDVQHLYDIIWHNGYSLDTSKIVRSYTYQQFQVWLDWCTDEGDTRQDTGLMTWPFSMKETDTAPNYDSFTLHCGHITTAWDDASFSGWGYRPACMRVMYVDTADRYLILGIVGGGINDQAPVGLIKVNYRLKDLPEVTVKVNKKDSDSGDSLSGAEFTMYTWSVATNSYSINLGTFTDNKDGTYSKKIDLDNVYSDTDGYWILVKETKAPSGYELTKGNTDTWIKYGGEQICYNADGTFKSGNTTFRDKKNEGYLKLEKASADTGITNENSNYSLSGAVYTVYKTNNNGKLSNSQGTLTTKADGTTGKLKLAPGTYYVQETTAPKGYQKDDTIYTVKITASHTSSAPYTLKVSDTPQTGNLKITKKSALPEISNNNDCYSLEGAEFTIYKNAACTQVYKTIKTNKDGVATCSDMPLGKYWVKETKAPKGFELNTAFYEKNPITITASHTADKPLSLTCMDVPGNDPTGIEITKIQNGEHTDTIPTLEGTQFTIKYYDGYYTKDNLPSTAKRTWVLEVKEVGNTGRYITGLTNSYLVEGSDELYKNNSGGPVLPYGTITIQETKPAAGYTLNGYLVDKETGKTVSTNSSLYVAQINKDTGAVELEGGNTFEGYNTPVSGSIKLKKYDSDGTTPLAGVTFELTNSKGEVVGEKTTGSNGEVLFDDLYPDIYTVTETKTVSGHTLLAEPIVVEVPMRVTEEYINDNNIKDDAVIYDPAEDIYYIHNFTYEITNDVTFKMPMSGGLITPMTFVPLIAGMGIMSGLGVVGFRKKRKK